MKRLSNVEARRIIRMSTGGLDPKTPTEQQQKIVSKLCEAAATIGDLETAEGIQRIVSVLWGDDMAFQLCSPEVNRTAEATDNDDDTGQGVEMDADEFDDMVIGEPPMMGPATMSLVKTKAVDALPVLLRTLKAHKQGLLSKRKTYQALEATLTGRAAAVAMSLNRIESRPTADPKKLAAWVLAGGSKTL